MAGHPDREQILVSLHLYDVSYGLAKKLSGALFGKQVDGLWRSSIVVGGVEYAYLPPLKRAAVHDGGLATPDRVIPIGHTEISARGRDEAFQGLSSRYSLETFDPLFHNSNSFANEFATLLTGSGLPDDIMGQVQDILATPVGEALYAMLTGQEVPGGSALDTLPELLRDALRGIVEGEVATEGSGGQGTDGGRCFGRGFGGRGRGFGWDRHGHRGRHGHHGRHGFGRFGRFGPPGMGPGHFGPPGPPGTEGGTLGAPGAEGVPFGPAFGGFGHFGAPGAERIPFGPGSDGFGRFGPQAGRGGPCGRGGFNPWAAMRGGHCGRGGWGVAKPCWAKYGADNITACCAAAGMMPAFGPGRRCHRGPRQGCEAKAGGDGKDVEGTTAAGAAGAKLDGSAEEPMVDVAGAGAGAGPSNAAREQGPSPSFDPKVYVHVGVSCDVCGCCPIVGACYHSLALPDFDACYICKDHPVAQAAGPYQVIPQGAEEEGYARPPVVHWSVSCDICGAAPIVGLRFRSLSLPNFDHCAACKEHAVAKAAGPYQVTGEEPKPQPTVTAPPASDVGMAQPTATAPPANDVTMHAEDEAVPTAPIAPDAAALSSKDVATQATFYVQQTPSAPAQRTAVAAPEQAAPIGPAAPAQEVMDATSPLIDLSDQDGPVQATSLPKAIVFADADVARLHVADVGTTPVQCDGVIPAAAVSGVGSMEGEMIVGDGEEGGKDGDVMREGVEDWVDVVPYQRIAQKDD